MPYRAEHAAENQTQIKKVLGGQVRASKMGAAVESHLVYRLDEALYQDHDQDEPCLRWEARYKIAMDVAKLHCDLNVAYADVYGELKPSNILLNPQSWRRAASKVDENTAHGFGKFLLLLISAKDQALPRSSSNSPGRRRRLGKGESVVFQAAIWLRRHGIPPLPWACPLRRNYIFDEVEVDGRVKKEIMASPRAIIQATAAIRLAVECTQDEARSRPTMENAYDTLARANTCEIPLALTAAVSIGFGVYRFLAALVYVVLFLYVGVYRSVALVRYYLPYAYAYSPSSSSSSSSYDPLDAMIVLLSLLAFMAVLLRTVGSMNELDEVLYWNTYHHFPASCSASFERSISELQ